jgi:hypothetical protein
MAGEEEKDEEENDEDFEMPNFMRMEYSELQQKLADNFPFSDIPTRIMESGLPTPDDVFAETLARYYKDGAHKGNCFEVDISSAQKQLKKQTTAMASQLVDEMAQASEQRAAFQRGSSKYLSSGSLAEEDDDEDPDRPPSNRDQDNPSNASKRDKASKKKKKKKSKHRAESEDTSRIDEEEDDHICKICTQ